MQALGAAYAASMLARGIALILRAGHERNDMDEFAASQTNELEGLALEELMQAKGS